MGKGKAQKTAAYAKASAVAIAPRVGARDKMAGQDGAPRMTEDRFLPISAQGRFRSPEAVG